MKLHSDGNNLTGNLSESLFSLPNLKVLNLGECEENYPNECPFLQSDLINLCNFSGTKANNLINGTLPDEIGKAEKLQVIDLRKCIISTLKLFK